MQSIISYIEEVHQLFLDREEDGNISDTSTIDSDYDSEEKYSIDGEVTVETEPDPNDGFDGDAKDAATNPVAGIVPINGLFKCENCEKMYAKKSTAMRHVKYECGKQPSFGCAFCGCKAFYKFNIMKHMKKHQHLLRKENLTDFIIQYDPDLRSYVT
ncbi:hypothetical protein HHI36_020000 [Cryptolaemus montrouzieri]|uniref:C2H2-type domain-containing protein n=1 Tax=Cryptolaemus montrouzieri TaxID=559131 RepID=A0ABD2NAJ5_9CUCU